MSSPVAFICRLCIPSSGDLSGPVVIIPPSDIFNFRPSGLYLNLAIFFFGLAYMFGIYRTITTGESLQLHSPAVLNSENTAGAGGSI